MTAVVQGVLLDGIGRLEAAIGEPPRQHYTGEEVREFLAVSEVLAELVEYLWESIQGQLNKGIEGGRLRRGLADILPSLTAYASLCEKVRAVADDSPPAPEREGRVVRFEEGRRRAAEIHSEAEKLLAFASRPAPTVDLAELERRVREARPEDYVDLDEVLAELRAEEPG
jgi:hypothetical protein